MSQPALIVDGMSVFHSVAGPAAHLRNGYPYSFLIQVTSAVKKFKPKGIFVCWEGGFSKRLEIYPEYKAQRTSNSEGVKQYREVVKDLMTHLGVDQLHAPGYEADDVGALLANNLENAILFSNDKDWLQLVRPGVSLYQRARRQGKKQEKMLITTDNFAEISGWSTPQEYLKAHIAMGDEVDGIPGVGGVGHATIHAYLTGVKIAPRLQTKLDEFYNGSLEYFRNKALIDLTSIRELPIQTVPGKYDERSVLNLLEELTFASITKQFHTWVLNYKDALL